MKAILTIQSIFGSLSRLWIFTFLFSMAVALLVQLVILPFWFSVPHVGHDSLIGGDSMGYHTIALELLEKIEREGWGAWELRPHRQSPAGIAAVFYFFWGANPWSLVPINAAVHASTAVLLACIVTPYVPSIRYAGFCVTPFIFFPSSVILYSQLNKDGIYFLGISLCLYGWLVLSHIETWISINRKTCLAVVYVLIGCFLVWAMRSYGVRLMQAMGYIFAIVMIPCYLIRSLQRKLPFLRALIAILVITSLPMLMNLLGDGGDRGEVALVQAETLQEKKPLPGLNEDGQIVYDFKKNGSFDIKAREVLKDIEWKRTNWLPSFIDNSFMTLSIIRNGHSSSVGSSNLDTDKHFQKAADFLLYLPRATQIGFAAPFPTSLMVEGGGRARLVKTFIAIEMIIVYAALFFLPYTLWRCRKKLDVWLIFGFSTILLLLYTYIMPNVGTLSRWRYLYLITLVALGIAGVIAFWRSRGDSISLSMSLEKKIHKPQ